jgi:hypothetical protein
MAEPVHGCGFGMEEGTEAAIAGREFGLAVGEPAEFRFLTSTLRKMTRPARSSRTGARTSKNSRRSK